VGRPRAPAGPQPVDGLDARRLARRELGLLAQHNAPAVLLERGDPLAPRVWQIAREIAVRRGLVGSDSRRYVGGNVVDGVNELIFALDELGVPRELAYEHKRRLRAV
jgi:hypothetical protein